MLDQVRVEDGRPLMRAVRTSPDALLGWSGSAPPRGQLSARIAAHNQRCRCGPPYWRNSQYLWMCAMRRCCCEWR